LPDARFFNYVPKYVDGNTEKFRKLSLGILNKLLLSLVGGKLFES